MHYLSVKILDLKYTQRMDAGDDVETAVTSR